MKWVGVVGLGNGKGSRGVVEPPRLLPRVRTNGSTNWGVGVVNVLGEKGVVVGLCGFVFLELLVVEAVAAR